MAWNHPEPDKENSNIKSEIADKPISVKIAYSCCGLLSAGGLLLCALSYLFPTPYGYNPWTVGVYHFTWSIVTAQSAVKIIQRNWISAVFAIFIQFVFGCVFFDPVVSMVLAGVPLFLLLLPQSRRWLKVNSRFSMIWAIVYVFIVCVGVIISKSSIVTEKYIAGKNPVWVLNLGDTPIHPFNETNAHVYDYWQNGTLTGNCIAIYNRHNACCQMLLNISNPWPSKDPVLYNQTWQELKDACQRRFGNVKWTVAEDIAGFPTLSGNAPNGIMIEIFCPDNDLVYCTLAVYDPKLLDDEDVKQ